MASANLLDYFFPGEIEKYTQLHNYLADKKRIKLLPSPGIHQVLNTLVHSNTLVSSRAVLKFINFVDARKS